MVALLGMKVTAASNGPAYTAREKTCTYLAVIASH
jgi:hypothetical protein